MGWVGGIKSSQAYLLNLIITKCKSLWPWKGQGKASHQAVKTYKIISHVLLDFSAACCNFFFFNDFDCQVCCIRETQAWTLPIWASQCCSVLYSCAWTQKLPLPVCALPLALPSLSHSVCGLFSLLHLTTAATEVYIYSEMARQSLF